MAKPLGAKSILIREAIKANPKKGNKEIAELLNDAPERKDDKIKVSVADVAQQKQAMKKSKTTEAKPAAASKTGGSGRKKRGRRRGQKCFASVGIGTYLWSDKLLLKLGHVTVVVAAALSLAWSCCRASSRRAFLLSRASSNFRSRSAKIPFSLPSNLSFGVTYPIALCNLTPL
jgi:hypothetical protein